MKLIYQLIGTRHKQKISTAQTSPYYLLSTDHYYLTIIICYLLFAALSLFYSYDIFFVPICFAITNEEVTSLQSRLKDKPIGERIAFWAERFVGTPYDTDPKGEYVTKGVIVSDERVDCMYLTFRAVELALSNDHNNAINIALDKRFHSKGIIKNNRVVNYDRRFEYGEDMILSGKWGENITHNIGKTIKIKGSRGLDSIDILPVQELIRKMQELKSGDIIFFVKAIDKRTAGEIVGHIGIIKIDSRNIYLIHAGGTKDKGGVVKKILFRDYIKEMPFIGAMITRFD
ncbi:hypothetical protein JZK55_05820 [Dissulfurispira thermophila]|uniref:Uncharacterized protein n=2 Tax=root TaxID=1 RepID=A0A7G1GYW1_9BACT|nr:DUF1460 domain-containing protein [Dissulfurispira thermophila]BCB95660.1 hypothetical protein JZK55_05820 [Dissulfurispira thermophila]